MGVFQSRYPIYKSEKYGFLYFYRPLPSLASGNGASASNKSIIVFPSPSTVLKSAPPSAPSIPCTLKVANTATTEDAFTNFLFVNPKFFEWMQYRSMANIVAVSRISQDAAVGGHSSSASRATRYQFFSIAPKVSVPEGVIMASLLQRAQLGVVKDNFLNLDPLPICSANAGSKEFLVEKLFAAHRLHTVTVEVRVVQGKKAVIDCSALGKTFCERLNTQCITVGRQVVLNLGLCVVAARVTAMELEHPETGEVYRAVDPEQGGEGVGFNLSSTAMSNVVTVVSPTTLSPENVLVIPETDDLILENQSMKQLDAQQQQVIQSFKLENLGIGGLRDEFTKVFQRAFASRALPLSILKKLGIKHVKGVLLYGPPGTGKTLIARKIGEILNCREPKIVNGPELFSKYVGQSEENVRKLFAEAISENAAKGEQSQLHLIIFDEFDSLCKQRGGERSDVGVGDNVVNQLLSMIDGVNALPNVLLIGMTNRMDLIDEAVKRPGRFEVLVEIGLPNEEGRQEIFRIHTSTMRESNIMATDVNLEELAHLTRNYSGAEIEGVVRAATSSALRRHIDLDSPGVITDTDNIEVTKADFYHGLEEVPPAFGRGEEMCEGLLRGGIKNYGRAWEELEGKLDRHLNAFISSKSKVESLTLLLHGSPGCGRSAVAAYMAKKSAFPYVKVISAEDMVGDTDSRRVNKIRKTFDDAYKSQCSCVILDDLERLISYSAMGMRYSNDVLQALLVLVKCLPPPGRRIFIMGTTADIKLMQMLELEQVFSVKAEVSAVEPTEVARVCMQYEYNFDDELLESDMPTLLMQPVPIKRFPHMLEMIANDQKVITRALVEDFLLSL